MSRFPLVALLPMRHESERVPGKNYRAFAGRPLYHWIVQALRKCVSIDKIVIDTDSPWIQDDAGRCFPDVLILDREPALRGGMVPMNEVLISDVRRIAADAYLQTHSTNPMLTPATIEAAIQRYHARSPQHDSLFSVTRDHSRYWDASGRPLNHDPDQLLRTQDLPPVFKENSCLYLFARDLILSRRNRIGTNPVLFEVERVEAWDIDDEADFAIAELLFRGRTGADRT